MKLSELRDRFTRWAWHRLVTAKAGPPHQTIGPGDILNLRRNAKCIRIAPCRGGERVASVWRFWIQGSEIYAAGRNHIGVHKLSFHKGGKWYTTLNATQKELARGKLLEGGRWIHAMQLCYLVGDDTLPPLPEPPFDAADPPYLFEILPGEQLVAHLLIGTEGTTLESSLPNGYEGYSRLFPMKLRNSKCAILIGGQIPATQGMQEALAKARALHVGTRQPPDLRKLRMEAFTVEVADGEANLVTVVPLWAQTMTTDPRPTGAVPQSWRVIGVD